MANSANSEPPDPEGYEFTRIDYSKRKEEVELITEGQTKKKKSKNTEGMEIDDEFHQITPPTENGGKTHQKVVQFTSYGDKDNGPFIVNIELEKGEKDDRLNLLSVGKILKALGITDFDQMTKIGQTRCKIIFKSRRSANKLLADKEFKEKGLKAYIPIHKVRQIGVLRNVPKDFTTEEIRQELTDQGLEILDVYRMKRRTRQDTIEETFSVKVTIKASSLPPEVKIFGVPWRLNPYVFPVTQCQKCLLFGHITAQCKRKNQRCAKCGNDTHELKECTEEKAKCIFCKGSHLATSSKECDEYERQKEVKKVMAAENKSFQEALQQCPKEAYYKEIQLNSDRDFPPLTFGDGIQTNRPQQRNSYASFVRTKTVPGRRIEIERHFEPQENDFNTANLKATGTTNSYKTSEIEKLYKMLNQILLLLQEKTTGSGGSTTIPSACDFVKELENSSENRLTDNSNYGGAQ